MGRGREAVVSDTLEMKRVALARKRQLHSQSRCGEAGRHDGGWSRSPRMARMAMEMEMEMAMGDGGCWRGVMGWASRCLEVRRVF